MNKKQKNIIIALALLFLLVLSFTIGFIINDKKLSNGKDEVIEYSNTDKNIVVRDKNNTPIFITSVTYNSYSELSQNEIDNLSKNGYNSVLFEYDSKNKDACLECIDYSFSKGIHTGIKFNTYNVNEIISVFEKHNVDYVVINTTDESKNTFEKSICDLYSSLKAIDNAAYIGYIPQNVSEISKSLYSLVSNNYLDFLLLNIEATDITAHNTLSVWNETPVDILVNYTIDNLIQSTKDDFDNFINIVEETKAMSQCKGIFFGDYITLSSADGDIADALRNFIIKNEKYFENIDFNVSNQSSHDITTDNSVINFSGAASPLYDLICNGNKIDVADSGDYSYDINLKPGDNKIIFSHKGKEYIYNVFYTPVLLKSISPDTAVTVPGGINIEIKAVANKNAELNVIFNGNSYRMLKTSDENEDNENSLIKNSDFTIFETTIKTPSSKAEDQNIGRFTVTADYNGKRESKNGAYITISGADSIMAFSYNEAETMISTDDLQADINVTSTSRKSGVTRISQTRAVTRKTTTANVVTSNNQKESSSNSPAPTDLYDFTKDYGLGKAKICVITDDYAETYSGNNTSSKSSPEYTPLLKGTTDYITGVGTCTDSDDDTLYYYLSSGVKVPYSRKENSANGKATITHLMVADGYIMPKNTINIVSCTNTSKGTEIKISMNRLVPFNVKLTGQSYSSFNGRNVAVSGLDCTGLQITFADTNKASGRLSFMNSVIGSGNITGANNTISLNLTLSGKGRFYGVHYEYKNGNLTILIKSKPDTIADYTIMLDPGHGGSDPGASCAVYSSSWNEAKINLSIANKIKEQLEAEGATVIMTRSDDSFRSLTSRNAMVRTRLPDLFISIHCDSSSSSSAYGTTAYYYRAYSQPLAKAIHNEIVKAYNNSIYSGMGYSKIDRGTNFYAFRVTRVEECPAVLIEYGFVSNTTECQSLINAANREKLAKATVRGILNYIENN